MSFLSISVFSASVFLSYFLMYLSSSVLPCHFSSSFLPYKISLFFFCISVSSFCIPFNLCFSCLSSFFLPSCVSFLSPFLQKVNFEAPCFSHLYFFEHPCFPFGQQHTMKPVNNVPPPFCIETICFMFYSKGFSS